MISVQTAREFAKSHFPKAPEKLATHLDVIVRESAMDGCDGWCLTTGKKAIVRINSNLSASRRRFTLAHELAHLILGIPTVVGESFEDMLGSDTAEERQVNELASELLIPTQVAKDLLRNPPIVAAALKKLSKTANVSELAAAIRVCNIATEIGLVNASVVLFDNSKVRWQWSKTLSMSNSTAAKLLQEARRAAPGPYRRERNDGKVVVASTIENPYFGSATLFVQLLPAEIGLNLSHYERRKELEVILFADDQKLRERMSGFIGALKNRIQDKTQTEVEAEFWQRYRETLKNTPVATREGKEYVKLRIGEWF